MAHIEVQVKRDQLSNQIHISLVVQTIPHVENRVHCIPEVIARTIERDTDWCIPPLHYGHQVI